MAITWFQAQLTLKSTVCGYHLVFDVADHHRSTVCADHWFLT